MRERLQAVFQQAKQLWNPALANLVSHRTQRRGQLRVAFRDPQQRSHGIAHRRRFQQPAQVFKQRGISDGQRMPAAARPPNDTGQCARIIKVFQATADRAAGEPRGTRCCADPAMSGRSRLRRHEQPSATFIQAATNRRISFANR